MGKKSKKGKNPTLVKRYLEGYKDGLYVGVNETTEYLIDKLVTLEKVDRIGLATVRKIAEHFGVKDFEEQYHKRIILKEGGEAGAKSKPVFENSERTRSEVTKKG